MTNKKYKINLEKERPVINILGEICWGFDIDDFENVIGVKKTIVEALLERLLKEEKDGNVETYISSADVLIIQRALEIVEKETEEWEFPIRFGVTLEEVKKNSIFSDINL
jgi:hypothetical protein